MSRDSSTRENIVWRINKEIATSSSSTSTHRDVRSNRVGLRRDVKHKVGTKHVGAFTLNVYKSNFVFEILKLVPEINIITSKMHWFTDSALLNGNLAFAES